jgi:predicted transcriptional regulator
MMLASVANNLQEKEARDRLFAQYPSTLKGRLQALKQFTQDYVAALKDGKGFDSIGRSDSEKASSTPDTTPSKTLVTYP